MNIPGDSGHPWRLNKFVEYQHFAPAVDPLTYCEYAKMNELTPGDCVVLAWYHSLTYCEITAALLFKELPYRRIQPSYVKEFWEKNKQNLIFGSARKYVKNMDWFFPLMDSFMSAIRRDPYSWLEKIAKGDTPEERYNSIEEYLSNWKYMGRFSVDLFTEALIAMNRVGLIPIEISNSGYDWYTTSNLTSGTLNIFYNDDLADIYDKTKYLPLGVLQQLDDCLDEILRVVKSRYPNETLDKVSIVNKICSFRNLFKKSRYGGFHHDRQLGNLVQYRKIYPEHNHLWDEFFSIRAEVFPRNMLGEYNGWMGIRPDRKRLWVEKGLTGVEPSSGKH